MTYKCGKPPVSLPCLTKGCSYYNTCPAGGKYVPVHHDYETALFGLPQLQDVSGPLPDSVKKARAEETKPQNTREPTFREAVHDALGDMPKDRLSPNMKSTFNTWFRKDKLTGFTNVELKPPERKSIFDFLIETRTMGDSSKANPVLKTAGICLSHQFIVDIVFEYFQGLHGVDKKFQNIDTFNYALACIGIDYAHLVGAPKKTEKTIQADRDYAPLKNYEVALKAYEKAKKKGKKDLSQLQNALNKAKEERAKAIARFQKDLIEAGILSE